MNNKDSFLIRILVSTSMTISMVLLVASCTQAQFTIEQDQSTNSEDGLITFSDIVTPTPVPTATTDTDTDTDTDDSSTDITVDTSQNRGISYILQMCSAKAKDQKKFWNKAYEKATIWNAGWMYGNTSNPNGCTWSSKFMAMNKPKRIRVHICNSTCFPERGRTCQPTECFAGMTAAKASAAVINKDKATYKRIDKIIDLAKSDYKLAPKGTVIDYAVSACLECTLSVQARTVLNNYIKKQFSDIDRTGQNPIRFVDNPYGSSCLSGYLCESHGTPIKKKKGIADNDGVDYDTIAQISYWKHNANAWMVLAWKPCLNGVEKVNTAFVAPQKRTSYCVTDKEGVEFSSFTDASFTASTVGSVNAKDTVGCDSVIVPKDKNFVWKLSDTVSRNYTTWLAPAEYSKFSKVELWKNGVVVDRSYAQVGYRFGTVYTHDTGKQRRIYDFRKNIGLYPANNAVLHADRKCFILEKPQFRPLAK